MKFETKTAFGDRVIIDGDGTLVASVVGYSFRTHVAQVAVSWMHNGDVKEAWVDDWRLSASPASE